MLKLRIVLLALLATFGLIGPAFAHAALVASDPAQGVVLATAPAQFTLRFNEPVSPLVLNLVTPNGVVAALEGVQQADGALHVPAPPGLENGTFVLSYRVISADGHPIGGTVSFSIGAPGGNAGTGADAIDWPLLVPIWAAKVLVYMGLFFGVGSGFFRTWMASRTMAGQRFGTVTMVAGLLAAPLSLGLQGLDALDQPLGNLLQAQVWAAGLSTSLSLSLAVAAAAMVLGLVGDRLAGKASRMLTLLAMLGVGLSFVATGHASSAEPHWLTRIAVFVHGVSVAFWAGALVPLWQLLRSDAPQALPALQRFSRTIPAVLVALVGAGFVLAVVQLGSPAALLDSAYGRVLLVKLGLVALVLVLAAVNRWRLTETAATATAARRQLVRIIAVETVLLLVVVSVVALWRFTPPPRALVPAAPLTLSLSEGELMADITLAPGGNGDAAIMVMGATAQGVSLILSNPSAGIEAMIYGAQAVTSEDWTVPNLLIPTGGDWTVQVDIRVSDFDLRTLRGELAVP